MRERWFGEGKCDLCGKPSEETLCEPCALEEGRADYEAMSFEDTYPDWVSKQDVALVNRGIEPEPQVCRHCGKSACEGGRGCVNEDGEPA